MRKEVPSIMLIMHKQSAMTASLGEFWGVQGVFHEHRHIVREWLMESVVNEEVRHPVAMSWAQPVLIPGNLHVAPKCPVNHEESALKVRVAPRSWGTKWRVLHAGI